MKRHVFQPLALVLALGSLGTARAQFTEAIRTFTNTKTQAHKKIAYFKIKDGLVETPTEMPPLFGNEPPMSLKALLDRFKKARHDEDIVAVVVDLPPAAIGIGQLHEIHEAMRKFAAVDKEVYVHAESLRTMSYAVATGASHISVVPTGDVWLTGIYGETPFLRGTLDKLGCVPDFERCGDYKSAVETFMRTGPSEENQRMMKWLIDGLYDDLVAMMADARGFSQEKMRDVIDAGPYTAEDALKAGLIDAVQHRQDFIADLKKRYGRDVEVVMNYGKESAFDIPKDPFAMIPWLMQLLNPSPKVYTRPSVAIIYVEGAIQVGSEKPSPFSSSGGAFSTDIRKALDQAAKDDSVKAVVLRVDSPGGSALASEIILNASQRVARRKPLIVSMGNVAGSGGYYVACGAETIFADPTTITGSIGVLGGKIVTTGLWDKLGVNWHAIKRGKMSALLSTSTPFSDAERRKLRSYLEEVYATFKQHVVTARRDRLTKPIDAIAGGRVYTGRQGVELGLVDKLGGLEDALKYAGKQAGISEYEIRVIPEPKTIFDLFLGGLKEEDELARSASIRKPSFRNAAMVKTMLPVLASIDPLRARAVLHALQRLDLIHQEGIVMMMPEEILIR